VLPRKILEFGSVVNQVACGRCHTLCVVNKKLYSFGLGSMGQLGIPNDSQNTPALVLNQNTPIFCIYAGGDQSFVVLNSSSSNGNLPPCDFQKLYADKQKQILTITKDYVSQMCSANEPVNQEIMEKAEILFASPACWNASFLMLDKRSGPCTWRNIGIDLNEVHLIF